MKEILKNILNKIMIIFIIITILFAYFPVLAEDNDSSEVEEEESTEEEELTKTEELENQKSELEDSITEAESDMEVVKDELSESLAEVEELSLQISEKESEISTLESEETTLMAYIEEAEAQLEEATENYETQKSLLEARLIAMYESSKTTYLDILLGSNDLSDFLSKYYLIAELTESDYEVINSYQTTKNQMESITASIKAKKEELEETKTDLEKYKVSLSNMQILMTSKVNDLSDEEIELYNQIEEYKNEIENIEAEIKFLTEQEVSETYVGGNMIWPTPGYTTITSSFGMRTHPITGIYKLHTGVDIGAPYGSTFVAAADGVVINASYNTAYGRMVMIDHRRRGCYFICAWFRIFS